MNRAEGVLAQAKAVLRDDHFVYNSLKHGEVYVNKDAIYPNPKLVDVLAYLMASAFLEERVEVVIGPAVGGTILESAVVREFQRITQNEVVGIYAEQEQKTILKAEDSDILIAYQVPGITQSGKQFKVPAGAELVVKFPRMVIKREYDKVVPGKRVLVVEDILTTGESARRTIEAVRRHDGEVLGVAAICNRGSVTAKMLHVPRLVALTEVSAVTYEAYNCPLCRAGVPVNEQLGHGKSFMDHRRTRVMV